jgi:hypothetical protein
MEEELKVPHMVSKAQNTLPNSEATWQKQS